MVRGKFYWSQTVPWYEWMSEPRILQSCSEECGLKIWQLAEVIAYQIRPSNWQVFAWMSIALQSQNHEKAISDALLQSIEKIKRMRDQSQSDARTALAKRGAAAKIASDPKQADKALVRQCWDDWQKHPDRYKGKSAFARDMLDKFPNLKSQRVICDKWCPAWEVENITLPAQ